MRNWLILFSYFTVSLLNGFAWLTLTPIPDEAMSYYSINDAELTLYSYSFFITSVLLSIFSTWLVSKSINLAMHEIWITTFIGCWIRVLAKRNFWISFLGQLVVSCGNMPMLVACSTVATAWFPKHQIVLATSIAASANFVGMGMSFVYITHYPDVEKAMWYQAYFGSVFLVFHLITCKDPPEAGEKIELKYEVGLAFRDKVHMCFILLTSSGLGTIYSIISIIGLLLDEEGFVLLDIGWVGFIFSMSSLIGGLLAACLTEYHKSTKVSLIVFLILSILSSYGFAAGMNIPVLNFILAGVFGATIISTLPLGLRACIEYMDNIHESIPTNMIYMISQVLSCVYTYPIQYCKTMLGFSGLWIAASIVFVTFLPFLALTRKFKGSYFSKDCLKSNTLMQG